MLKFWDHKCKESKEIGEGNNFKQNGKYTDWKIIIIIIIIITISNWEKAKTT